MVGKPNFSDQFKKIIKRYIKVEYNKGGTSFVDLLCCCTVVCLLCLCARLFICA